MTVFHNYQWDLNYTNPDVFVEMLDTIMFYANLGVDILRIDAPAFIWKQLERTCQNLPQAHTMFAIDKTMCAGCCAGYGFTWRSNRGAKRDHEILWYRYVYWKRMRFCL